MNYVVHCKRAPYDVYIGRPTVWGNPYTIGKDGTRAQVIEKHRKAVLADPHMIQMIKTFLKGRVLGCWCSPKPCHGDTLAKIANE